MSNEQGMEESMKTQLTETDIACVRPLRCPVCGNDGESSFSAATAVLIDGRTGIPRLVLDYAELGTPFPHHSLVDCSDCGYEAPFPEFDAAASR